jgi:hypothetical protein
MTGVWANDEGLTLREAALASVFIDAKRLDEIADPGKMVGNVVAGELNSRGFGANSTCGAHHA